MGVDPEAWETALREAAPKAGAGVSESLLHGVGRGREGNLYSKQQAKA